MAKSNNDRTPRTPAPDLDVRVVTDVDGRQLLELGRRSGPGPMQVAPDDVEAAIGLILSGRNLIAAAAAPSPPSARPERQTPEQALAEYPLMMDRRTAAAAVGMSPRRMQGLTDRGHIRCRRMGGVVLVPRSALIEFLDDPDAGS